MTDDKAWFEETASRAKALSAAFKSRRRTLWWFNLLFVVVPAVLTTAAAVLAALPKNPELEYWGLPLASIFAGIAVVLIAVHKALKCDEYQAECLRLGQAYESIAIKARSLAVQPDAKADSPQARLTQELVDLTKSAQAQVKTNFMSAASS